MCAMTFLLVAVLLSITDLQDGSGSAQPQDEIARDYMARFEPTIGQWRVQNWVVQSPGEFTMLEFNIEVTSTLDGLGLQTHWRQGDDNDYFGYVVQTFNPSTQMLDQHYFNVATSMWSSTVQDLTFDQAGYGTSFTGEDQYGPFEARTRTTMLPDGAGFDWTIERKYPGTDWFMIDRGEARPQASQ
jgi:hypothetical protein